MTAAADAGTQTTDREPGPPKSELPGGIVTFLFTDIEGSTPLWEQQPAAMRESLAQHHVFLRRAIESHAGFVCQIIGDAFLGAFRLASDGLAAALDAQRLLGGADWNATGPLRVRMGLHTGPAEPDPKGDAPYAVCHTLNRGSRVMSAAHGGQVLCSQETADLVERDLPANVTLRDLGEHYMKGMAIPEHLHQVCAADLPADFPPLANALNHPNNLPAQLTSFVGRQKEVAAVSDLLAEHRLVTLTGTGGTGKTRLSLRVAAERLSAYPHGAWLVEFAPLTDPALVDQAAALALNVKELPGKPLRASLRDYLRGKRLLLIFDNCEHLVEACAELAGDLLGACPEVSILASSREILGVAGERPYRVPPLSLPGAGLLTGGPTVSGKPALTGSLIAEFAASEAVQLFVERGQIVSPGFAVTPENGTAIAQIVRRLDGIPLALELAAARLRLLSAAQIAARLDDAFRLLTGGSRSALPRHQTLQALIDWSYTLLSEAEKHALQYLSAFAGSWTLEAAEGLLEQDALDLLASLTDKSLIYAGEESSLGMAAAGLGAAAPIRYRMLETVRQYAHTRLVENGAAEAARGRHMRYYLGLAARCEPKLRGRAQIQTLDLLESELENLRLALEWALQADVSAELRLAAALQWFWHIRYRRSEGIAWLELGLNRGSPDPDLRARVHTTLGFLYYLRDSGRSPFPPEAAGHLDAALSFYRANRAAFQRELAWALLWRGNLFDYTGFMERKRDLVNEALGLFRAAVDRRGTAECLQSLGNSEADPDRKLQLHQQALDIDTADSDADGMAAALNFIAMDVFMKHDYTGAHAAYERSLQAFLQVGNPDSSTRQMMMLAVCSTLDGETARAAQEMETAIARQIELGDDILTVFCLAWQCFNAYHLDRLDWAAELVEKAGEIAARSGDPGSQALVLYHRARQARLKGEIDAAARFAAAGLAAAPDGGAPTMLVRSELSLFALRSGSLNVARDHLANGLQSIIRWNTTYWAGFIWDGLAVAAARGGQHELAARLFGTRLWRGLSHTLTPAELAERQAEMETLTAALGPERFEQLRAAGAGLNFARTAALVLEQD